MEMELECSFRIKVEAGTLNQSDLKAKVKELLRPKLPPNVRNRKCEIGGRQDKLNITVNREHLVFNVIDVKETKRHLKGKTK